MHNSTNAKKEATICLQLWGKPHFMRIAVGFIMPEHFSFLADC
jgi:hypothetical protein